MEENIIILTDEEGFELEFEVLDEVEYEGECYVALAPVEEDVEEFVILKYEEQDGEEAVLVTVESDEVFQAVSELFQKRWETEE